VDREQDIATFNLLGLIDRLKQQIAAQDRILVNHANLIAALLLRLSANDEGRKIADEIQKDAREWNKHATPFIPEDEDNQWEAFLNISRRAAAGQDVTPS